MENKSLRSYQELMNELSYCFSSPEASSFDEYFLNKEYKEAKQMLMEYFNEEESDIVIEEMKKKIASQFDLIEIDIKDISLVEDNTQYLCKIGNSVVHASLYKRDDNFYMFCNSNLTELKNVTQFWKIKER